MSNTTRALASVFALALVVTACGDDTDSSSTGTTAAADETTTTAGDATTTTAAVEIAAEDAELCAVAQALSEQDSFPTADQLNQYVALAPEEIADAADTAAGALIAAGEDPVAQFAAFATDDVEHAVNDVLNPWEQEHCGIDHTEDGAPTGDDAADAEATRVDVVASEYTFDFPTELAAGSTAFVLTNAGQEAHFMVISQLAPGHTLDEALAYDGDPEEAGIVTDVGFTSGLAAPGGEDEEFINADLEPGDYAMLCFVSGPDGTPHAFLGMAVPFTVS